MSYSIVERGSPYTPAYKVYIGRWYNCFLPFTVYRLPSFQPRQLIDGNKGAKHKAQGAYNKPP